jgi:tRNA(fMet)-specific endonuclease VapC
MSDYLLDTTTASFILKGSAPVTHRLRDGQHHDHRIFTSVITEGELLTGLYRAGRDKKLELEVAIPSLLADLSGILQVTRPIVATWAALRAGGIVAGNTIPMNDLWIAATAIAHDMILVAHDQHFTRIPGLKLEDWLV